jgi:hypothetical protein
LLSIDNGSLSSSSLDSGWAFKGSFLYESDAQEQAQAIMSRLHGIVNKSPGTLVLNRVSPEGLTFLKNSFFTSSTI